MFASLGMWEWSVLAVCGALIGMSKTGFQGITTPVIPILAMTFGGKESTGVILPMLCMADLIAVLWYRRNARWSYILKLIPYAVAGFFLAIWVDRFVPADQFKRLMALCIALGLVFMAWTERKGKESLYTASWWYGPAFGILGGFTTMIGNAAGPVMAVYLLSMKLPKYAFVGTSAWFFLMVNYLKIPLQIFVWHNITWESFAVNLATLPAIVGGAAAGIVLVRKMPEQGYRRMIVWLTVLSTVMLLV